MAIGAPESESLESIIARANRGESNRDHGAARRPPGRQPRNPRQEYDPAGAHGASREPHAPDSRRALTVRPARLKFPRSVKSRRDALLLACHRMHDAGRPTIRTIANAQVTLQFALQFFRARQVGLVDANTSAISMIPALIACTSSPIPGTEPPSSHPPAARSQLRPAPRRPSPPAPRPGPPHRTASSFPSWTRPARRASRASPSSG